MLASISYLIFGCGLLIGMCVSIAMRKLCDPTYEDKAITMFLGLAIVLSAASVFCIAVGITKAVVWAYG